MQSKRRKWVGFVMGGLVLVVLGACSEQLSGQRTEGPDANLGTGGAQASGGHPSSGGSVAVTGGATGSGGSPSSGGTSGSGGAPSPSSGGAASGGASPGVEPDGAPPSDCSGESLCESFEDQAVGAVPSGFTLVDPEMGQAQADSATIDGIGAHGSQRSLKVVSHGRIWVRHRFGAGAVGPVVHARFSVRFDEPLAAGHVSFAAFDVAEPRDAYDENQELRFGGQENVFHWNNALDDRNVPSVSPVGNAASVRPAAKTWYCVALDIDTRTGRFSASVDGAVVPALVQDGEPTPDIDAEWLGNARLATWTSSLVDFSLGFRSYSGSGNTVWFDDVALGDSPIACP